MPVFLLILSLLFLTACFDPEPPKPLKNTYWSLIELNEEDSENADQQPAAHLVFHINDNSLHGSDGCNHIQGRYIQGSGSFVFKNIVSTRMVCQGGMAQAAAFQRALNQTDRLKIEEDQLILYHEERKIARFEGKEDY